MPTREGTPMPPVQVPVLNNAMALVDISGPDAGPLEIERKVFENEFVPLMYFSIKKHGTTRTCQLDVLTGHCS